MTTYNYYKYFDNVIEECLVLIAKMQEKRNQQLAANVQMMTVEPREDQPCIDIVTRSGNVTENDKAEGKKEVEATWIRKTTENSPTFDILKEKKAFMEVR